MASRARVLLLAFTLLVPAAGLLPTAGAQAPPAPSEAGPAKVYPTYPHLTAELKGLAAEHKDIVRLRSAGTSTSGMHLWYVEVADFEAEDRRPLEERETLYLDGGTHANEYIGVIFVMTALRDLVEGYGENETATWIVENRRTVVLPLVNPEGSMNGVGRLNDRGVNINRNFPVGWYDVNETPVVNDPGPHAASEPETRAVLDLWEEIDPDYVLSIHCCGNLWLYPYGIEGRQPHPDDASVYERICDEVLPDVREDCGPTWSTIYPASGITSDSGYELHGANSWSFEMSGRNSRGFPWGPPLYLEEIPRLERESWRALQHAFLHAERYGAHPELAVEAVHEDGLDLRVRNTGWGNLSEGRVEVVDDDGGVHEVALPDLAPGGSGDLAVPGSFGDGEHEVELTYRQRPLDDDLAVRTPTLVVDGADASLEGPNVLGGNASDLAGSASAEGAGDAGAPVPGPGVLAAAVLALAGLGIRFRRGGAHR